MEERRDTEGTFESIIVTFETSIAESKYNKIY